MEAGLHNNKKWPVVTYQTSHMLVAFCMLSFSFSGKEKHFLVFIVNVYVNFTAKKMI